MATKAKQGGASKPRLFLESKAKRVMGTLGWDFEKFAHAYEVDAGSPGRKIRPPSAEERRSVERFLISGDFAVLKKDLGTRSIQTANSAIARVMALKAQRKTGVHEG